MVADGFTTDEAATTVLGRSLRLHGGATLPPLRGVELAPGAAFVWWQLALGTMTALGAVAALLVSRLPRLQTAHAPVAIRALLVALCLLGAAVAVRSFRTA